MDPIKPGPGSKVVIVENQHGDIYVHGEKTPIPHFLTNIPSINPKDVLGRTDDLAKLKTRLGDSSSLLLMNGTGGIGKTTLAKLYVNNFGEDYGHLAWVEQKESLIDAVANDPGFQKSLNIQPQPGETFDKVFYEMMLALQNMDGHNLLVLDNVDQSIRKVQDLLPYGPHWQVLLTSRQVIGSYELMELGKLEPGPAKELFVKHCTKPQDEAALDAFLEKIAYHTLSIELFSKILEAHWEMETVDELATYLDTNHLDDETLQAIVEIEHAGGQTSLYRHLLQAFDLSGVERRPELMQLMKQMAALPPSAEGYPVKDLMAWCGIEKDKITFVNHLQELYHLGWLVQPQKNQFGSHRLIKTIVNHARPASEEDIAPLVKTFTRKLSMDYAKDNPIDKFQWILYGQAVLLSAQHLEFNEKATLQNNLGLGLKALGDYAGAKGLLEKAMASAEKNFGAEHPTTAVSYSNLALVLKALGDYAGAKGLLEKAYAILKNWLGDDHPNTKIIRGNLEYLLELME
jgi:tetratricopeptide (TPR) repeat protein